MSDSPPLPVSEPGRIPEEITAAINEFELEVWRHCAFEEGNPKSARAVLDAAILSRLEAEKAEMERWKAATAEATRSS